MQPGFIFGGDTGETAESLARKRAIAQRMVAGSGSAPRNVGEGIARIGEALAGAYIGRKASDAQKKGEAEAAEAFASIFGGMGGGALGAGATAAGATATMPANTSPGIIETQPLPAPASPSGYSEERARSAIANVVQDMESGGNPAAVSPKGAGGSMQIMPATARDPGYGVPTIYDFAQQQGLTPPPPPEAGDEAMTAWLADPANESANIAFGDAYLEAMQREQGGDPALTLAAYNAGPGAVEKFGGVPPYAETQSYVERGVSALGGQGGARPVNAAPAPAPQPAQAPQGPDQSRIAQIAQVMQHPFINPAQRAIAEQLLQAELAKAQPAMTPYQQAQLELAQRRLEAQLSGQIGGGPNITVNTGQSEPDRYLYGSDAGLPAGWRIDRQTGEASPIPGGPAAVEAAKAEEKKGAGAEQTARAAGVVIEDLGRIRQKVESSILPVTGLVGAGLSKIPGTNAYDVSQLVETVGANIGFDRLQAMREASPTGGALGSITERELAALRAVLGSLEQGQTEEQFIENLGRLEEIYAGIMSKAAGYPNAAEFGFTDAASSQPESDPELDAILEKYK